ncbi:hypothetical protein BU24DRAFT_407467 [Aaosphaeria arxii CBS 175.79]|uniref:Uncharacterized protein n=1 Tax=Aaosphaeria arxii CBS 175.79 TaxID=1450172 RepID=A0A6A5XYU1_9PLEO|nr:uncharacterized protein BU24DRAFT_407467 [Aaosphaeria arxii CBS 175.79]KAF2017444.1 hypothetical protein BU24DRAFT_407467 [Aaosphaeria arxii CBS 175.79]
MGVGRQPEANVTGGGDALTHHELIARFDKDKESTRGDSNNWNKGSHIMSGNHDRLGTIIVERRPWEAHGFISTSRVRFILFNGGGELDIIQESSNATPGAQGHSRWPFLHCIAPRNMYATTAHPLRRVNLPMNWKFCCVQCNNSNHNGTTLDPNGSGRSSCAFRLISDLASERVTRGRVEPNREQQLCWWSGLKLDLPQPLLGPCGGIMDNGVYPQNGRRMDRGRDDQGVYTHYVRIRSASSVTVPVLATPCTAFGKACPLD